MMFGQKGAQEQSKQRTAEHAREYDQSDFGRDHK